VTPDEFRLTDEETGRLIARDGVADFANATSALTDAARLARHHAGRGDEPTP
jgi:hypothetical protein